MTPKGPAGSAGVVLSGPRPSPNHKGTKTRSHTELGEALSLRVSVVSPYLTSAGRRRWVAAGLLVLLLILLGVRAAAAENLGPGGARIIVGDEVIGDYRLFVTSAPNPALVGPVTFVVRVSDPQTGATIRDAQVEVELTLAETGQSVKQEATHANAGNETDYAAHIPVEQEGSWNGVVRVSGARGVSEAVFIQRVTPQRQFATVILIGVPFLAILVVFGAMWYARSSERKTAQK